MNSIPMISKDRLYELVQKVRPVARFVSVNTSKVDQLIAHPEGDLWYIHNSNPRMHGLSWNLLPIALAEDVNPIPYKAIQTLHRFATPVFFSPSIAEVLAQIPEEDISRVVAFEIVTKNIGFSDNERYHRAKTALYERRA